MTKKPEVGDLVEVECSMSGLHVGVVQALLSMQFTYRTNAGQHRFCLYAETWRKI